MRKHTRRKIWKKLNPIEHALIKAALVPEETSRKVMEIEERSLDNFRKGIADFDDWNVLASLSNVSEVMALDGVGEEVLIYAKSAQLALKRSAEFHKKSGKFLLDGEGIADFEALIEYAHLQRQSVSTRELEGYINKIIGRIHARQVEYAN